MISVFPKPRMVCLLGISMAFLLLSPRGYSQVSLDDRTFPDAVFRQILSSFDIDSDGILSKEELKQISELQLSDRSDLLSLEGIHHLVYLKRLYMARTGVTQLVLGSTLQLTHLDCSQTPMKNLDLEGQDELEVLDMNMNPEMNVSLGNVSLLRSFSCRGAGFTQLDLAPFTSLEKFDCGGCNLLSYLEFGNRNSLQYLDISQTALTSLSLAPLSSLAYLDCSQTSLSKFDLRKNTALTYLDCSDTEVKRLDLENNLRLVQLDCSRCPLTHLDLSYSVSLESLKYGQHVSFQHVDNEGFLDLSTIPGFDPGRASGWEGGFCQGNFLKIDPGVKEVRYRYQTGFSPAGKDNAGENKAGNSGDRGNPVPLDILFTMVFDKPGEGGDGGDESPSDVEVFLPFDLKASTHRDTVVLAWKAHYDHIYQVEVFRFPDSSRVMADTVTELGETTSCVFTGMDDGSYGWKVRVSGWEWKPGSVYDTMTDFVFGPTFRIDSRSDSGNLQCRPSVGWDECLVSLEVYPNPTRGKLLVRPCQKGNMQAWSDVPHRLSLEIIAVNGRCYFSGFLDEGETELDLRDYRMPPGIYLFRFCGEGRCQVHRVILLP